MDGITLENIWCKTDLFETIHYTNVGNENIHYANIMIKNITMPNVQTFVFVPRSNERHNLTAYNFTVKEMTTDSRFIILFLYMRNVYMDHLTIHDINCKFGSTIVMELVDAEQQTGYGVFKHSVAPKYATSVMNNSYFYDNKINANNIIQSDAGYKSIEFHNCVFENDCRFLNVLI